LKLGTFLLFSVLYAFETRELNHLKLGTYMLSKLSTTFV
jgi:hypothetical protein